jgi:hypothetical protein
MEIEYSEGVKELQREKTPLEKAMERAWVYRENQSIANRFLWKGISKEEEKLLTEECNRLWLEIVSIDPRGNPEGQKFISQFNKNEESGDAESDAEPVTEDTTVNTRGRKEKK